MDLNDLSQIATIVEWHFAWTEAGTDPFDPETMAVNDEFVKNCDIAQEQGGHAVASVTIRNRNRVYSNRKWAWISCTTVLDGVFETRPWMLGYLEAWPVSGDGREITLRLIGKPEDWSERQEAVLADSRVAPFYDEAFIGSRDPVAQPEVTLEARPSLVHCDPRTHQAALVSVIDAADLVDIGDLWQAQPEFSRGEQPLDEVRGIVTCRYRQPVSVPFVIPYFGYTLTPSSVWQGIPRVGAQLETGYTVRQVDVDINIHADGSDAVRFVSGDVRYGAAGHIGSVGLEDGDDEADTSSISRWSFGGSITTQVSYEIERSETYTIVLRWNGQTTNRIQGPSRSEDVPMEISMQDASGFRRWRPHREVSKFDLYVYGGLAYVARRDGTTGDSFVDDLEGIDPENGNISDPLWERYDTADDRRYGSSFFGTARGVQALQHALLVLQARLAVSRSVDQGFGTQLAMLKPAMGLDITCAMMMRASGFEISDGTILGKITNTTLSVGPQGSRFVVQIMSCPGSGQDPVNDGGDDGEGDVPPDEVNTYEYAMDDFSGIYAPKKTDYPAERPDWWPVGRSWPPNAAEDTLGAYTHSFGFRYEEGNSILYQVSQTIGLLPPLASNPYEGVTFPAQKPSWWPIVNGDQFNPDNGKDVFPWPPGTPIVVDNETGVRVPDVVGSSDPFQFYKVPPENDFLDGSGGVRGEVFDGSTGGGTGGPGGEGYQPLPASAEPWDKVMFKQTVVPYIPGVPTDFLAPARQGQDEQGNPIVIPAGVEVKWDAAEQERVMSTPGDPHWDIVASGLNRNPLEGKDAKPDARPGDPEFDPEKALDKMETEVVIHLVDVSSASSAVDFAASAFWNGPKHVDLEQPDE